MRSVLLFSLVVVGCGSTIPVGGSGNDMASSGADAGGASNAPDSGRTDPQSDAGAISDSGSDGALAIGDAPGPTCTGTLTDAALVTLFSTKPLLESNARAFFSMPEGTRTLGSYTSSLYKRGCNSYTGCGAWASTTQPQDESFQHPDCDLDAYLRRGEAHFWNVSGKAPKLMFVSDGRNAVFGSACTLYTVGTGDLVRSGVDASMTLSPGNFPYQCSQTGSRFEARSYYPSTGIVTDHCLKLAYRKELNRIDVGPGAYTYDDYAIVYEATY